MQVPFNRGELLQAIARYTGFKGQLNGVLEPAVNTVLQVGDVEQTPYLRIGIPVGRSVNRTPTAAMNSWAWVMPGAAQVLQITRMIVTTNGAATGVVVRMLSQADFSILAPVGTDTQMADLGSSEVANPTGAATFSAFRSSKLQSMNIANFAQGAEIYRWIGPNGIPQVIEFPPPWRVPVGQRCFWGSRVSRCS